MLTRKAIGNLLNRYSAVLKKCAFINACALSLAVLVGSNIAYAATTTVNLTEDTTYRYYVDYDDNVVSTDGGTIDTNTEQYISNYYGNEYTIDSGTNSLTLIATPPPSNPYWGNTTLGAIVCGSTITYNGKSLSLSVSNTSYLNTYGYQLEEGSLNLNSKETKITVTSNVNEGDKTAGITMWNGSLNVGSEESYTESLSIDVNAPSSEAIALDVLGCGNVNIYTENLDLSAVNNTDERGAMALRVQGEQNVAIYAETLSLSATNSSLSESSTGSNVYGINIMSTEEGFPTVALHGDTTITINDGNITSEALHAQAICLNGGNFDLNSGEGDSNNYTKITGDINVSGDVEGAGTSIINFNTSDSFLEGNLEVRGDTTSTLRFNNGATWTGYAINNQYESLVSHISLNNGSTWIVLGHNVSANWNTDNTSDITQLSITDSTVDMSTVSDMLRLETDTLEGNNGLFVLKADVVADEADQVHIIKEASGAHAIKVASSGTGGAGVEEMQTYLVRQESGEATFALSGATTVDLGTYTYSLATRAPEDNASATEWFLKREETLSPSAELVLGLSGISTSYSMWMAQLSDIRERSGEFRRSGVNGFWMRTSVQENELSGIHDVDFTQTLYNVSMGYDRCIADENNKKFTVGMQAQLGYAEQDVHGSYGGSGDNTTFGFSAYATLEHDSGAFLDFVGTWNYYDQNLKTHMLDNTPVSGTYDNYGVGLSVEGGYSFDVGNNIFIEPQAQFSYYRIHGVDYSLSNDMAVKHDTIDSATGRLGIVVGKNWDNGLEGYLKFGVNHEFAASQSIYVNDERFDGDLDGTRVYYGLGLDWQINETTSFYGELEREDGEHFTKKWGANIGVKIEF